MKNHIVLISMTILMLIISGCNAQRNLNRSYWNYEVQDLEGISSDGRMQTFVVWSYGRTKQKCIDIAGKNAVHAVIFHQIGLTPALASAGMEEDHTVFFNNFFRVGGDYLRFVQITNNDYNSVDRVMHTGRVYKVGVEACVNRIELKNYLEQKGILTVID